MLTEIPKTILPMIFLEYL